MEDLQVLLQLKLNSEDFIGEDEGEVSRRVNQGGVLPP
jgi:hypothetical protein